MISKQLNSKNQRKLQKRLNLSLFYKKPSKSYLFLKRDKLKQKQNIKSKNDVQKSQSLERGNVFDRLWSL